jgi:hypothetical protein
LRCSSNAARYSRKVRCPHRTHSVRWISHLRRRSRWPKPDIGPRQTQLLAVTKLRHDFDRLRHALCDIIISRGITTQPDLARLRRFVQSPRRVASKADTLPVRSNATCRRQPPSLVRSGPSPCTHSLTDFPRSTAGKSSAARSARLSRGARAGRLCSFKVRWSSSRHRAGKSLKHSPARPLSES